MRPLVYSAAAAAKRGHGWTRVGNDVYYHENGVARRDKTPKNGGDPASHSTLSFTWVAEYDGDTMYFAMYVLWPEGTTSLPPTHPMPTELTTSTPTPTSKPTPTSTPDCAQVLSIHLLGLAQLPRAAPGRPTTRTPRAPPAPRPHNRRQRVRDALGHRPRITRRGGERAPSRRPIRACSSWGE